METAAFRGDEEAALFFIGLARSCEAPDDDSVSRAWSVFLSFPLGTFLQGIFLPVTEAPTSSLNSRKFVDDCDGARFLFTLDIVRYQAAEA